MSKRIILYLPRSKSIATNFQDFLDRWEIYTKALRRVSEDGNNIEILTDVSFDSLSRDGLKSLFVGKSRLRQVLYLYHKLKHYKSDTVLIAGNNFDALFICLSIRSICRRTHVQASLHMETSAIMRMSGTKGLVKRVVLRTLIPRVDSLRLVRKSEIDRAIENFKLRETQVVVCPLPISPGLTLDSRTLSLSQPRLGVLGYVGRIQEERNPLHWSKIATQALKAFGGLRLVIAGDGPMRAQMQSSLQPFLDRIIFKGKLENKELMNVWSEIHTLLVTAPYESYGLAAREALLNGCFVVAPNIEANRELRELMPSGVRLYETFSEAVNEVKISLEQTLNLEKVESFRVSFWEQQQRSLEDLARSWI